MDKVHNICACAPSLLPPPPLSDPRPSSCHKEHGRLSTAIHQMLDNVFVRHVVVNGSSLRACDAAPSLQQAHRNRNCRFRLDTSMVSMSMTSMLPKPDSARSLSSSQPRPPAPTHSTRADVCA